MNHGSLFRVVGAFVISSEAMANTFINVLMLAKKRKIIIKKRTFWEIRLGISYDF